MNARLISNLKRKVSAERHSGNIFIRIFVLISYKLWRVIRSVKVLCTDANFRSVFFLKLLNSKNVHQTTSLTYPDRYPRIFAACRDYFGDRKDLKILSYGCSTGEEVLTLRGYFPDAQIVGAEINKRSLAICRRRPADEKIVFVYSELGEIQKYGDFDAVFCMAVLQRTPHLVETDGIRSLKKIYPFEKFERQIAELDKLIKPQGLLIIKFTQYSFLDTPAAAKYKALGNQMQDHTALLFDKNSCLVSHPEPQNIVFIKMHE